MSRHSYFILCVVAVAICIISKADATCREDFKPIEIECQKKFGISDADLDVIMKSSDVTKVNPRFWGCYFKKLGIINDKGQCDLNGGLAVFKKYTTNDIGYANLEDTARKCETVQDTAVSDNDAVCAKRALVAACFMKNTKHRGN